jgi:hypothetical protein
MLVPPSTNSQNNRNGTHFCPIARLVPFLSAYHVVTTLGLCVIATLWSRLLSGSILSSPFPFATRTLI